MADPQALTEVDWNEIEAFAGDCPHTWARYFRAVMTVARETEKVRAQNRQRGQQQHASLLSAFDTVAFAASRVFASDDNAAAAKREEAWGL